MATPPPINLMDLLKDVAGFTDRLEADAREFPSAAHRDLFGKLIADLRLATAKGQELFPLAGENLQKIAEEGQARALKAQADLADLRKQLDQMEAEAKARAAQEAAAAPSPAAAPTAPPLPPLDPALGGQLRHELLTDLLGPGAVPPPPPPTGKDIWQGWEYPR